MEKEEIKLKINLPFLKLELKGDPAKHLGEIRKIIMELNKFSLNELEADALEELMPSFGLPVWKLSSELQKNEQVMNNITELSQIEDGVLVKKTSLDNINEITDTKTISKLNVKEISRSVSTLFDDINKTQVNFAIVHAIGNLPADNFSIIFDQVKKHLPNTKIEAIKTKKEVLGKTVIECVLFGNFPNEE
ncbi:hypothetical protein HN592_01860 [Candidatus Woesearchaeota archaeon]|nr:hypothetical protein [Candidatus Woesearchaeota archaeon]MBT4368572.1 hypothetical protein [Candidatus Woesearchaeota archaeon]MBT4713119.1 hypothetical protein [Candidatus Woesearchaeota archaeon]MBT6639041.1 hypothetical protein [Candidatus Woesearchaeota archaeon]MBT7134240.1 hypothetical protein [Candidatus Woesearchaeota archaeon]